MSSLRICPWELPWSPAKGWACKNETTPNIELILCYNGSHSKAEHLTAGFPHKGNMLSYSQLSSMNRFGEGEVQRFKRPHFCVSPNHISWYI